MLLSSRREPWGSGPFTRGDRRRHCTVRAVAGMAANPSGAQQAGRDGAARARAWSRGRLSGAGAWMASAPGLASAPTHPELPSCCGRARMMAPLTSSADASGFPGATALGSAGIWTPPCISWFPHCSPSCCSFPRRLPPRRGWPAVRLMATPWSAAASASGSWDWMPPSSAGVVAPRSVSRARHMHACSNWCRVASRSSGAGGIAIGAPWLWCGSGAGRMWRPL